MLYSQHDGEDHLGRIMESLGGGSRWKDMDLLAEDIPAEVQQYLKDDKNGIRVDERTAEIMVIKIDWC